MAALQCNGIDLTFSFSLSLFPSSLLFARVKNPNNQIMRLPAASPATSRLVLLATRVMPRQNRYQQHPTAAIEKDYVFEERSCILYLLPRLVSSSVVLFLRALLSRFLPFERLAYSSERC